ncbi:ferritin, middle subunit-like [Dreissena polymorpha]|uniref:Ferritin n=1 Tax=Dreissena polymorpha TaxID=45954 RepID=A0A9D4EZQ9_DREPO|nr:ferritin, middle subunit-like [Dreissena polymorpha]KAH3789745.1 hypothetical protein DPMN_167932 [Dreissena polymorpha]
MSGEHSGKFSLFVLVFSVTVAVLWMPDFPRVVSMKTADAELKFSGGGRRLNLQKPDVDERFVYEVMQNYDETVNRFLAKSLIAGHLEASYQYLYMSNIFARSDVALPGFAKFFQKASNTELNNAQFLLSYINKRGGFYEFRDIDRPSVFTFVEKEDLAIESLGKALHLETVIYQRLTKIHERVERKGDAHLSHTLQDHFLEQKVDFIKELKDHIARLSIMKPGQYDQAVYLYDREI